MNSSQKVNVIFTAPKYDGTNMHEEFVGVAGTLDKAKALALESIPEVVMWTQYEHINYGHDKGGYVLVTIRTVDFQ